MQLYEVKTCALLHDVGKPECWAYEEKWTDHVKYTYRIISGALNENLALTAMRHHSGPDYPLEYNPETDVERIIDLADDIASGADRPEEAYRRRPRPKPPISLSHPLSRGLVVVEHSAEDLKMASEEVRRVLAGSRGLYEREPQEAYLRIYEGLSKSRFTEVPAYTEPPINDHSLFDHARLTTAIATCMALSGGYKGDDPGKYSICLLSGDADRIKRFIDLSRRPPDLVGGSQLVKEATGEAAKAVEGRLGPDCVIYAEGGSILALAPPGMADETLEHVRKAFTDKTGGQLTMTLGKTVVSGEELRAFGEVWRKAVEGVRGKKRVRMFPMPEPLPPDVPVCDVCGIRRATKIDPEYIKPIEARPGPELLCELCYIRRVLGRGRAGIAIDSIAEKDPSGLVAVLKMDGDDVGRAFTGEKVKEFDKSMSPARLATLSRLIHRVCEQELEGVVKQHGGECVYAGGDDVLAILPGVEGLLAAYDIAGKFTDIMVGGLSMSAGVVLMKPGHPLYMALQASTQLLQNAKGEDGKASLDYEVIRGVGYLPQDLERGKRVERRAKGFSGKPYKWRGFKELLMLVERLKEEGPASSQLRALAKVLVSRGSSVAEYFIKKQVGRGYISYEEGKRLLGLVKTGIIPDGVELLGLMKEG